MSGKMHKYNEKKVKQPGKVYENGEPVPGTGVTTKKKNKNINLLYESNHRITEPKKDCFCSLFILLY